MVGGGGRGGRIRSGYYCPLHENLSAKFMISIKVVLFMLGLHLQTFIPIKYHFKRFMASKTYRKTYGRNYTFFLSKSDKLKSFYFSRLSHVFNGGNIRSFTLISHKY